MPVDAVSEEMIAGIARGECRFLSLPRALLNHVERYGILPKKSPDGSRVIRFTSRAANVLDTKGGGRKSTDLVRLSHQPTTISHLFCGFDHGSHELICGSDTNPDRVDAQMNLAQLNDLALNCTFCCALVVGVNRYRELWQPQLEMWRYVDNLHDSRGDIEKDEFWALLHGADRGYFDTRYVGDPPADQEVALYVDISEKCVRVQIQKFPHPDFRRMTGLTELEFFIREGMPCPWPAIGSRPEVCMNVLSENCIAKLQRWIQDCLDNHQLCKQITVRELPTRLLEISRCQQADGSGLSMHLVRTDACRSSRYVALSHSWASSKPLKTTKANYEDYQINIPWEHLSQVYKDTFALAAAMAVSYVWIDSLCIVQGDPDDWEKEAPRMALVYSNAYIVFVALGSSLALEKEPAEEIAFESHTSTQEDPDRYTIQVRRKTDHENLVNSANDNTAGAWFSRAWCFQERLFASRALHFGGSLEDITFECNTHLQCECGGVENLYHARLAVEDEDYISSLWCHMKAQYARQIHHLTEASSASESMTQHDLRDRFLTTYLALCEDFTAKNFTFPDDSLPAMAGLASRLAPYLGSYHAGLWEHRIVIQMQWESFDGTHSQRFDDCCAPTFSWASRTGGAIWYFTPAELFRECEKCTFAEVLEVYSPPANEEIPYGKVSASHIRLRSRTVSSYIAYQEPDRVGRMKLFNERDEDAYVQMDTQDDIDEILSAGPGGAYGVLCFELMRGSSSKGEFVSAIVLLPVQAGIFQRIGFSILKAAAFNEDEVLTDVVIV